MAVQTLDRLPFGSSAGTDGINPSGKRKAPSFIRFEMRGQTQPVFRLTQPVFTPKEVAVERRRYDVFLNFRGSDTRAGFADFLYKRLVAAGVSVFRDDRELLGKRIGPGLSRGIENSRIAIPIISKNYGESEWCLKELSHIMHCRAERGQEVLPVFYDVDVDDVRDQTGEFGKAFRELAKRHTPERVEEWKETLRSLTRIGGWSSRKVAGDGRLVDMVLKKVASTLSRPWIKEIPMFRKKRKKSKYEVFPISSPKNSLAPHLPYYLEREKITVFRDDDQYLIGKDVDHEVRNAMDHCKIFIPIISEDFSSSHNCLDKLVQMFKCVEENRQKILPIFYEVDLSRKKELWHLFWTDMLRHDVPQETRQQWLESFDRVFSIAGFVSENFRNGGELADVVRQHVIRLIADLKLEVLEHHHCFRKDLS